MKKGNCVVTGVAGFIGSHIAEKLIADGYKIIGIDSFEPNYPRWIKEKNISAIKSSSLFNFVEGDLLELNLTEIFHEADYIFHEAACAGVRNSWGKHFSNYVKNNVLTTQRILETSKELSIKKLLFASSSSVYGNVENIPTKEETICRPISPYGITKLTAEALCRSYHENFGIPVVMLRYFTVYGSRQRPDMAFHKFIKAIFESKEVEIYGDGQQTRDFTHVSDIVNANIVAMHAPDGEVFNIGGGSRVILRDVISIIEKKVGKKAIIRNKEIQKGDVRNTWSDLSKAQTILGYNPETKIEKGLEDEIDWVKRIYSYDK
jgi:nucleoside-diphosphate-sugar epimerase